LKRKSNKNLIKIYKMTGVKTKSAKVAKVSKKNMTKKRLPAQKKGLGVQGHGKEWENQIISVVVSPSRHAEAYGLSHTAIHDIPKELNKKNPGTNVSIKATGTNKIDFGDARRTINNIHNENSPLEAIVVKYKQRGNQKIPQSVYRIDLTKGKDKLLGDIPKEELDEKINKLDAMVKKGDPAYKTYAKEVQKYMFSKGSVMILTPKKGNQEKKRAGRLQISLSNVEKFARDNPHLVEENRECKVYDTECLTTLESARRTFVKP